MVEQARLDDSAAKVRVARLDELLGQLEQVPGRTAELALDAVGALAEVYGEALARVADRAAGSPVLDALTADELLGHLFVLHDLHPNPAALTGPAAKAAPAGSCGGCKSTRAPTLIPVESLSRAAPDGRAR